MTARAAYKPGECARLACLLEVTAQKPGNVHPHADFDDVTFQDFVKSANAIAPVMGRAGELGLGRTVLESIRATREVVSTNTNLGIVLLLAPLVAASPGNDIQTGISSILDALTVSDADQVYEAIRLARPGGMGEVEEEDVSFRPSRTLLEVMKLSSERDLVALQYANGFEQVLRIGLPYLEERIKLKDPLDVSIVRLHLNFLSCCPDTLIARKCGWDEAEEAALRATSILTHGWPRTEESQQMFYEFDCWLREDGNRRNPGTTADLVTAVLFVALRKGMLKERAIKSLLDREQ